MPMRILVPIDDSKTSGRTTAFVIANRERFPSPLTLLHVVDLDKLAYRMIPDFQVKMIKESAGKAGEILLRKQQERLAAAGIETEIRLEFGSPREVIPRIANEEDFHLLLIARRGRGEIRDVLFGSVSNHVLHHARCPVLLI